MLLRNHRNSVAAMRLLPSLNEWLISLSLLYTINTQKMRVVLSSHFFFEKYIVDVLSDCLFITIKQNNHLISTQPNIFIFQTDFYRSLTIFGLINYNLVFHN